MDELIELVAHRAGISPAQASLAVSCVLAYLAARMPSPVVGRIRELLGGVDDLRQKQSGNGIAK